MNDFKKNKIYLSLDILISAIKYVIKQDAWIVDNIIDEVMASWKDIKPRDRVYIQKMIQKSFDASEVPVMRAYAWRRILNLNPNENKKN